MLIAKYTTSIPEVLLLQNGSKNSAEVFLLLMLYYKKRKENIWQQIKIQNALSYLDYQKEKYVT